MVPPPMIRELRTFFERTPIFSKNSAVCSREPAMDRISLSWSTKLPLGITTSESRSTAQISTSVFNRPISSIMVFPSKPISGFTRKCRSSTRPLAKVSILMADGNFKTFKISLAVVSSGLMIMEIPSCSLMNRISLL